MWDSTGEMPLALKNKPELDQFEQPFFEAFTILGNSRNWTMAGPSHIPLTEIKAYCDFYGITDIDERFEFVKIIQRLDSEYLKRMREK